MRQAAEHRRENGAVNTARHLFAPCPIAGVLLRGRVHYDGSGHPCEKADCAMPVVHARNGLASRSLIGFDAQTINHGAR